MREMRPSYPESEFGELHPEEDPLPRRVVIPPKLAGGKAVGSSKAHTSKRRKEKGPFLRKV